MTLGDLFEEHYNYKKDKVKLTTLSNYGKKIKKMQIGQWDVGKNSIDYHSLVPKIY